MTSSDTSEASIATHVGASGRTIGRPTFNPASTPGNTRVIFRMVRRKWLDPRPGVFHRRPKPPNCPTRRWSPARHFGRFVPGKGGSAQDRSRTEHRNQTRVPGVFISYHGACRRLAILQKTQTHHRRHDDDNDPRQKKRPVRDRAPHSARGMCGQWTWRGCGARLARALVRVVRHAERRRGI